MGLKPRTKNKQVARTVKEIRKGSVHKKEKGGKEKKIKGTRIGTMKKKNRGTGLGNYWKKNVERKGPTNDFAGNTIHWGIKERPEHTKTREGMRSKLGKRITEWGKGGARVLHIGVIDWG